MHDMPASCINRRTCWLTLMQASFTLIRPPMMRCGSDNQHDTSLIAHSRLHCAFDLDLIFTARRWRSVQARSHESARVYKLPIYNYSRCVSKRSEAKSCLLRTTNRKSYYSAFSLSTNPVVDVLLPQQFHPSVTAL